MIDLFIKQHWYSILFSLIIFKNLFFFRLDTQSPGISIHAAKYSSEDAAQMVEYVQAVVHFTKKYQPYKKALRSLKKLETEKEAMEKELVELGKPDEFVKFEEVVRH